MNRITALFSFGNAAMPVEALSLLRQRMQGGTRREVSFAYGSGRGEVRFLSAGQNHDFYQHPSLSRAGLLMAGSYHPASSHPVLGESLQVWEQEGLWLVFDGQIYNRKEIWQSMSRHTDLSDAWLVLMAYRKWGKECLQRFNGRWSFVLWDSKKRELWASRDRFGVKPLYYWLGKDWLALASEPKLLLSFPFIPKALSAEGVFDYFLHNKVEAQPETLWEGIRQLMPSQSLHYSFSEKELDVRPYYELPVNTEAAPYEPQRAEAYAQQVRERLLEAVQLRMREGVQPATLLSGGLDSSVLAAALQRLGEESIQVLTASYRDDRFAEQQWAGEVARHLHADWLQVWPSREAFVRERKAFFIQQDTPTFSAGTFAQYGLFKEAGRKGIRQLFDGQGADGLLAGHFVHYPGLWRELIQQQSWSRLWSELRAFGGLGQAGMFAGRHWLKTRVLPRLSPGVQAWLRYQWYPEIRFLDRDFLASMWPRLQAYPPSSAGSLNEVLKKGYTGGEVNFLLKCVDRAASWFGVETATPFSDDLPLIEMVFSIPGSYKIYGGERKHLLRKAFQQDLPASVIQRKDKMGLVTPNNTWIREMREEMRSHFDSLPEAFFNKEQFLKEYDAFFNLQYAQENYRTYKYMSFGIWWDVWRNIE